MIRAWVVSTAFILTFSLALAKLLGLGGLENYPLVTYAGNCLISVSAVFLNCLLFVYYWEARLHEANAEFESRNQQMIDV